MTAGEAIQAIYIQAGDTQKSAARLLGVTPSHLSRVVKGRLGVSAKLARAVIQRYGFDPIQRAAQAPAKEDESCASS